jgi:DnaJ-domain-containing protein 1
MGALRFLAAAFAVGMAFSVGICQADELVLPYSCAMDKGAPRLAPAEMTTYRIIGPRQDQPFTSCASSAAWTCETMMVHKFTIDCGGQRVLWARVAGAARSLGVTLPDNLPSGYAPVSRLKGRFVLPGFTKPAAIPTVSSELLSRDAVLEPSEPRREEKAAPWVTIVDPVGIPSSSSAAFKVAGAISMLLASLMLACLFLVRRRQSAFFEFAANTSHLPPAVGRFWDLAAAPFAQLLRRIEMLRSAEAELEGEDVSGTFEPVRARLHEVEFIVAMLPSDLLLRDVLASELDGVHHRIADLGRREMQLGPAKMQSSIRAIMRDLDRIARIAQGAMPTADDRFAAAAPEPDVPSTVFEAYRVLGLNPDAPDAAVKKIVDALRMSWHPDHARDEADRLNRELRIRKVNAAWDLLKAKLAEAA